MKTQIIRIDPEHTDRYIKELEYCGEVLRDGGLVAFPTETVYGLGANAFDGEAVSKIFIAKNRPQDNPLIVHIASYDILPEIAGFKDEEQRERFMTLGAAYWPGPLTMVVGKSPLIPDAVSCGLDTVGIRMPVNPVARALLEVSGVPIAAPSANSSGRPSPTKFSHVFEDMNGKVDVIIDGGDSDVGVESTVLDLQSEEPTVLRPGAITRDDVRAVLGLCAEYDWKGLEGKVEKPRSPGMKYRHYAPKAQVFMYSGEREKVILRIQEQIHDAKLHQKCVGVLATDETICYYKEADSIKSLGSSSDGRSQAARLFDALRSFDAEAVDVIYAEAVSEDGIGDAVMNRLFRAAGGRIIKCN